MVDSSSEHVPATVLGPDPRVAPILRFYDAVDSGRATEGIGSVTADAILRLPGVEFRGSDEIAAFLRDREKSPRQTLHNLINVSITATGEETAEVAGVFVVYGRENSTSPYVVEAIASAVHRVRIDGGEWKIYDRDVEWFHSS